ncbi:MAG: carboxypeptidase-like regulatory domain-containing protein [Bacteroidales bacterium]|nr:carboxypeptidase-like regulatory domain-containing protein [Bacteroidales bacterium]
MRKFTIFLMLILFIGLQALQAQTKVITGKVTGSEDGKTIPGVSVVVKGTTVGITTDLNGEYSLTVPEDAKALVFSFVGMKTQEIELML